MSVDVEIGSDLRMNQEYSMQIALELDEGTAYYYTRVVSRSQVHASDYAAFCKIFFMKRVLTKSQQMHWEVIWNHRQQEQQRITRELILILP